MSIIQTAEIIIASIISLGVLIAGFGYGYAQFKQGGKKLATDDIDLFNEQIKALKLIIDQQKETAAENSKKRDDEIAALRGDVQRLTQEIGKLQGINQEKDKKIKELTDLLANRDPALTDFIKFSIESTKYFQGVVPGLISDVKEIKTNLIK